MKQEKSMAEQLNVCGKSYRILRLLGHGKGGYSYLAEGDGQQVGKSTMNLAIIMPSATKSKRNSGIMNACRRQASACRRCSLSTQRPSAS